MEELNQNALWIRIIVFLMKNTPWTRFMRS
uniref:Uncharacterized protein n=1 Tax=Timema poppense TaxID=170557 RepID=A0A7R9DQL2_TIMPO|nr:unnamed protein product [Timema poppensis]